MGWPGEHVHTAFYLGLILDNDAGAFAALRGPDRADACPDAFASTIWVELVGVFDVVDDVRGFLRRGVFGHT